MHKTLDILIFYDKDQSSPEQTGGSYTSVRAQSAMEIKHAGQTTGQCVRKATAQGEADPSPFLFLSVSTGQRHKHHIEITRFITP